jgi:hypothetical protein
MKRKNLLFLLLMALIMPWAANAQNRTIVTIGEGTSTQRYPLPGYYGYQYDVYIYTPTAAPALDADCDISSIAFNVTTNNTDGESTMEIWVKDVDANYALVYSTTFDDYTAGAELVYENDDFTSTTGWNTLAFTRDFSHQGGKALLVAVRGVGCGTTACSRYCTYTSATNTTWYKHQDNTDPGTNVSGSVSSGRANIQLDLTYTGAICFSPSGLAASNVTDNSATLSWNENGEATAWVLQYGTDSEFGTYTEENVSTTPTFGLTGLTALTTYYARVKPDCDTEGSHWSNTVTFTTTAVATVVGDGWSDDFEGASFGWELINGTLTNQWAWGTAANNGGTHGLYISNDGGTSNAYSHSAAIVYATKLLNFTEGKFEFAYEWKANGESSYDYLRVALVPASVTLTAGTTPSGFSTTGLPSGWIALDGGSKLNQVTSWQSKSLAINVTAGNYYLVMAWKNDGGGGTQPPAAVDNVSITRLACPYDVTGLAVSDITTTGATLTWTAGEAEQWQVAYSTNSSFEGATEEIVSAATYTMTGLTNATTYYVKVRAYCGGTDFGSWSEMKQFNTACEALDLSTVDFSENFDDITLPSTYAPSTRTLPICWNFINTSTYSSNAVHPTMYYYDYTDYSHSTPNSLRLYCSYSSYSNYDPQDQYAILPAMENMEGKQITLWARGHNASSTFKIGMMTDPTDASTFEMIAEQVLTTEYQEFSYILGRGNYVAIMMEKANSSTSTKGVYIDDITIADVPTCMKPSDLTLVNATTTGATLSWTNGADSQTDWQIAYSIDPTFDPDEVTPVDVTSNPGTINGLTAATIYYAYVRANCGNDGYSEWSANYCQFVTACETFTITENDIFTEGFEDYTGTTYNSNGVVPPCWDSYTTGSVAPHIIGSGSYYYHHQGTNALTFYGSGYCYAAMPEFTNAISELQIKFWMQTESATSGALVLGYITDEDENYSTFTAIETYANNNGSMVERFTYLNEVPSEATRLVFRWYYSSQYSCCIDDVEVSLIPSCLDPSDLEVTATTITTATLSWTENGNATAWQIMLNDDENNLIPANANPFTLEGLTGSTTYTVKVRAYCSADDQSDWTSTVSFATACAGPITITAETPYTQNFEAPVVTTTYNQVGEMPTCWDNYPEDAAASAKILAAGAQYNYAAEGQVLYFYGSGDNYAALPEFTNPLNTLYISFKYATESDSYGTLTLGYITDEDENYNTFTAIEGGTFNASSASDDTFIDVDPINLSALPTNATRLVFRWTYTGQWGCNVDDVMVSLPFFTKEIIGYGNIDNPGGYYLIASPIGYVNPEHVGQMTGTPFDLYRFNQENENEWENYITECFDLEPNIGYLYANSEDVTLTFVGYPNQSTMEPVILRRTEGVDWAGWNLVGNPFAEAAYIQGVNGEAVSFYTLNADGSKLEPVESFTRIEPMEGVFVYAESENEVLEFTRIEPAKSSMLVLNMSNENGYVDRVMVNIGQNRQLPKFMLNDNDTKMYIRQDGNDYAVVRSNKSGSLPISFEPVEDGIYSISVNSENVLVKHLRLIDYKEGVEVDLLSNPNYRFEAKANDKPNRFELVFKTIGISSIFDVASKGVNTDDFGFCNNGNWFIDNEGEAILQVIDVQGRILSSEEISDCVSKRIEAAPGIYMLRLINGENVKVQKIVVQ